MAEHLEKKAAKEIGWVLLAQISSIGLRFFSLPILARFLLPEEFGTVVALVALVYFVVVSVCDGLNAVLIARKEPDPEQWQTAFWINLIMGIVFGIAFAALAGPICALLGVRGGEQYMLVLGICTPFFFVAEYFTAHAISRMRFDRLTIANLSAEIPAVLAAVAAAAAGYGPWALLLQQLLWPIIRAFSISLLTGFRPQLIFNLRSLSPLAPSIGSNMVAATMMFISNRSPVLFITPLLGITASGLFFAANRLSSIINDVFSASFGRVLFPNFSHSTQNPQEEEKLLLWGISANSVIMSAACFGLAALAKPATIFILGPEWTEAWPVLCLLAISTGLGAPATICNAWLQGTSRFHQLSWINTLRAIVMIGGIVIGSITHGLVGAAAGLLIVRLGVTLFMVNHVFRILGAPVRHALSTMIGPILVSTIMGLSVAGLVHLTPVHDMHVIVQLGIGIVTGVTLFAGLFWLTHPVSVRRYLNMFRSGEIPAVGPGAVNPAE